MTLATLARRLGTTAAATALVLGGSIAAPATAVDVSWPCPTLDDRDALDRRVLQGVVVASPNYNRGPDYYPMTLTSAGDLIVALMDYPLNRSVPVVAFWQNGTSCWGDDEFRNMWLVTPEGLVWTDSPSRDSPPAGHYGDASGLRLNEPVVGMSPTPTGTGYWLVASDGGIFSYGDAEFLGSTGDMRLNQPIVGMTATPSGRGYWLVASDGGIFTFGDAQFFGSTGDIRLNKPIVGMTATPSGRGYWMVASDGGIFTFGDATFKGSTGDRTLTYPIAGMMPRGDGYVLVGSNGTVYRFL